VRERVRTFLGIYAPLLIGLALIALAVNFLLTPSNTATNPWFAVDPLASAACGGIVILVGGTLAVSTLGRWRKMRLARRQ